MHDNSERPDVDLNLIQRQLTAITSYLKMNVWKGEDADKKKTKDAGERKAV
jgi:hypothetical protein